MRQPRTAALDPASKGPSLLLFLAATILTVVVVGWIAVRSVRDVDNSAPAIGVNHGCLDGVNVLLVSIDTIRADRVGCYGYAEAETPTLDALATGGIRCTQAVAPVPLTLPSHASMLTGLDPPRHEARANAVFSMPEKIVSLAEILQGVGYRTGAVLSAFVLDRRFGLAQGFDRYVDDLSADGRTRAFGYRERIAEDTNRHALTWLDEKAEGPFFLWVHYFDPHFPYVPPEPFATRHQGRPYDGEIAYTDAQLGALLDGLQERGLRKNTLVVVAGDHGEALGEHGELTHGLLLYEATMLVPLILHGPDPLPRGLVVDRQVGLIDIMPTVLDLLGITPLADLDGVSLLSAASARPRSLYIETLWPKLMHNWSPLAGLRRSDVKYILAPSPELYDLTADPGEQTNLIDQRSDLAAELLAQLRDAAGEDPHLLATLTGTMTVDSEARERLASLGYVMATSAPTSQEALPDPKDMMGRWAETQQASQLVHAKRFTEAIALLEPFVHHHPRDVAAVGLLAQAYLGLERYADAEATFQRHAELSIRKAEPLAGLGLARVHLGNLDSAEQALQRALAEDPELPAALFALGLLESRRGNDDEARKHFEHCVRAGRGSQTAPAYLNIGVLEQRAGNTDRAREAFRKALELNSRYVDAAVALAKSLRAEGQVAQAAEVLGAALRSATRQPAATTLLAGVLNATGRHDEAIRLCREVLAAHPDHAGAHEELASAMAATGRTKEAVTTLEKALKLDPSLHTARLRLGVLLGRQGQLTAAKGHLAQVAAALPESATVLYNYGVVLARLRELAQARDAFEAACRLDPDNAAYQTTFGQVLLELGQRGRAKRRFQKALELDPSFEPAQENLRRLSTQPAPATTQAPGRP